jgi:hypothetical protein
MIERAERRSFESVNYLLRPKKQIERKIIIEILRELNSEIELSKYLYVGLGSIYYYDFILFHKFLKMNNLLSIDNKSTRKRFEFNRPYDFILFENKTSTEYLSEFDWQQNTALWLDYDERLNDIVLADLKLIAKNCKSKDILVVTVNASCVKNIIQRKQFRIKFYSDFGKYISTKYSPKKYYTPTFLPELLQNVIINYLETMCEYRCVKFFKLFSFSYQDTSSMFTIGGVFDETDGLVRRSCNNNFIFTDETIKQIDVPILTYCEKFWLDSHIEKMKGMAKKIEDKVEKDTKITDKRKREQKMTEMLNKKLPFELPSFYAFRNYLDYYRYYPQYYEGIL